MYVDLFFVSGTTFCNIALHAGQWVHDWHVLYLHWAKEVRSKYTRDTWILPKNILWPYLGWHEVVGMVQTSCCEQQGSSRICFISNMSTQRPPYFYWSCCSTFLPLISAIMSPQWRNPSSGSARFADNQGAWNRPRWATLNYISPLASLRCAQ